MECLVHTTIGGYPLASTVNRYNRWYFRPEDRVIRCREQGPETLEFEFVYSITADMLRRRLGRAGYNRATLEREFWKYYETVSRCSEGENLHFTGESAEAYREAFLMSGSLDGWLYALARAVKTGVTPARRAAEGFALTDDPYVDIITGPDKPLFEDLEPEHGLLGFPCSTFNNMAVALLEVTDGNAVCELDVTSFVLHRGDITFDDMLGRRDEY